MRKQFFITFVYLLITGAIGGGIYFGFFYEPPSCTDSRLNQGEEETDCGGPCAECREELFNPKIIWSKVFLVESDQYDLATQIENKNVNYGSGSMPYIFKVYDAQNNLLVEKRGKSYIMPREKKYIIESVILSAAPSKVDLEFGDIMWEKFKIDNSIGANLNLPISEQKISQEQKGGGAVFVEGTVFNKTGYDLDTININVVVYDLRGTPLAVNKTQKNIVQAGQGSYFKMFWPAFSQFDETKVRADIIAHTNIFSDENFIRKFIQ